MQLESAFVNQVPHLLIADNNTNAVLDVVLAVPAAMVAAIATLVTLVPAARSRLLVMMIAIHTACVFMATASATPASRASCANASPMTLHARTTALPMVFANMVAAFALPALAEKIAAQLLINLFAFAPTPPRFASTMVFASMVNAIANPVSVARIANITRNVPRVALPSKVLAYWVCAVVCLVIAVLIAANRLNALVTRLVLVVVCAFKVTVRANLALLDLLARL